MTWLEDMALRDLDDTVMIEATCMRCLHVWSQSPLQLLLKVVHRDVRLDKDFRHIATLYDRLARNFVASVCLGAAIVWWLLSRILRMTLELQGRACRFRHRYQRLSRWIEGNHGAPGG